MKKKNIVWYRSFPVILTALAGVGVLSTAVVKSADYIKLPENLARAEEKIETVEDWIKEQQIIQKQQQAINDYYYNKEKQGEEVILSPDGRWKWDTVTGKWIPAGK